MKSNLTRLSLLTVALICTAILLGPAPARADEFNLKTFITVNQSFQVPGAVLQPNVKYVFRRLDSNAGTNHVVRVMNEDQSQVISTFFAAAAQRLEPADDTVLTFMETAAGYPKPVKTWFYPGRLDGFEFLYSKAEREQIAAHMGGATTIQTARDTEPETFVNQPSTEETIEQTTIAQVQQPVQEESVTKTEETEIERAKPADVTEDQNTLPAEDHAADMDQDTNKAADTDSELPHTAGELPLIALLGVAGLGLRMALRKL